MFLVGLTGGIATGKSTVSNILKEHGCVVIDSDIIARQVVERGSIGWQRIRDIFGRDICDDNGDIDRPKLGALIFSDIAKRRQLNAITHPLIRREIIKQVFSAFIRGERYVILDTALLVESKGLLSYLLSEIVIVYCNKETQLKRLISRNALTSEEAQLRISSQIPIEEKKGLATHQCCLIDNNGPQNCTANKVSILKDYLDKSWRPEIFRTCLMFSAAYLVKVLWGLAVWAV